MRMTLFLPYPESPPWSSATSSRICSHPWSHVVIGMWHKYPNPHCSHVVTIDVVDRSIDPQTGIIRTERILGCKQKAPTWIVKVSTSSVVRYVAPVADRPCHRPVAVRRL